MNNKDKIFLALIILIILLGIYVVYYIKSESFQCMSNPSAYALKNIEKSNNGNASCNCFVVQNNKTPISFTINSSGINSVNYLNNQHS